MLYHQYLRLCDSYTNNTPGTSGQQGPRVAGVDPSDVEISAHDNEAGEDVLWFISTGYGIVA